MSDRKQFEFLITKCQFDNIQSMCCYDIYKKYSNFNQINICFFLYYVSVLEKREFVI